MKNVEKKAPAQRDAAAKAMRVEQCGEFVSAEGAHEQWRGSVAQYECEGGEGRTGSLLTELCFEKRKGADQRACPVQEHL